ncbi:scavenger receptor class B member 1 [Harpegnathos saltator]|uniref:scavenger receptor class B member 1 n=1 Tax=Harpegnathos saltator TaxID=610380 RepID=UPI000DBECFDB|nr:scavenger receptor class B member 1 [Harpegnathos saltator]
MTITVTNLDLEKTSVARCARRSPFRSWPAWLYFGVFLVSFGTFYIFWYTNYLQDYVYSQLQLRNGSYAMSMWQNPPMKIYFKVHVFNYTNTEDFLAYRADKLRVEEVGPYIYLETKNRVNVEVGEDTITYQDSKSYEWVGGRSEIDDKIVVPNMMMILTSSYVHKLPFVTRLSLAALSTSLNQRPFLHLNTADYFWGYDDSLFDIMKPFVNFQQDTQMEKFGLFVTKQGINSNRITINSGTKDMKKLGRYEQINGHTSNNIWGDKRCNKIEGTDGTFFSPYLLNNRNNTLEMYSSEMCKSISYEFTEPVTHHNILTWRYKLSPNTFEFTKEQSKCYCQKEGTSRSCPRRGLFDTTRCSNMPILLSHPHFFRAEESLMEKLDGLHPRAEEHDSYIDVHPDIAIPMAGWMKLQINVEVRKGPGQPQLGRLQNGMILPLLWIDVGVDDTDFPQNVLNMFYMVTFTLHVIEAAVQWSSLVGMVLSIGALLVCFKKHRMEHPDVGLQMNSFNSHQLLES